MELMGGNALLARRHQVRRQKPFVQGDMGPLENRARADREFVPAIVAHEHPGLRLAAHLVNVVAAAKRAGDTPFGQRSVFHMLYGLGFVGENRVRQIGSHGGSVMSLCTPDSAKSSI